jgi:hypothetical protein
MTMAFEDAVPHMNCAILGRFVTPARGVAKIPGATSGDVIKIRNGGVQLLDITPKLLAEHSLRYGAEGLLEHDDSSDVPAIEFESDLAQNDFPRPAGETSKEHGIVTSAENQQSPATPTAQSETGRDVALASSYASTPPERIATDFERIEDVERELRDEQEGREDVSDSDDHD